MTTYKCRGMNFYMPPLSKSDQPLRRLHGLVRRYCSRRSTIGGKFSIQGRNKLVVLCIDDSRVILKTTAKILQRTGCTVHTAEHGQDALSMIYRHPANYFDVILTDIEMPVMNGIDFISVFRRHEKSLQTSDSDARTLVVCISSVIEKDLRTSALKSGADLVLEKPFSMTCMKLLHMAHSEMTYPMHSPERDESNSLSSLPNGGCRRNIACKSLTKFYHQDNISVDDFACCMGRPATDNT